VKFPYEANIEKEFFFHISILESIEGADLSTDLS
jgi:hypothetical protein